ncbi:hypothetical protein GCM10010412_076310 [Nonomuraea recticatena]|uniref:Tetracyclin repressor-like C-terminal group 31 domain-containing protein n=1 Tax=Nonomuraea recticatena TaxID=46178 RepID=A0ABN3SY04_9ACTN
MFGWQRFTTVAVRKRRDRPHLVRALRPPGLTGEGNGREFIAPELYRGLPRPAVTGRAALVAVMGALLHEPAGPGRRRLLAYLELQAEAARAPWLAAILDGIAAADFTAFEEVQRAAGLPVTPERAAAVTLAMHAAIPHLLADGPRALATAGLDDPGRFAGDLLDAVYGRAEEQGEEDAHRRQPVPHGRT